MCEVTVQPISAAYQVLSAAKMGMKRMPILRMCKMGVKRFGVYARFTYGLHFPHNRVLGKHCTLVFAGPSKPTGPKGES